MSQTVMPITSHGLLSCCKCEKNKNTQIPYATAAFGFGVVRLIPIVSSTSWYVFSNPHGLCWRDTLGALIQIFHGDSHCGCACGGSRTSLSSVRGFINYTDLQSHLLLDFIIQRLQEMWGKSDQTLEELVKFST